MISSILSTTSFGSSEVAVRINSVNTEKLALEDMNAFMQGPAIPRTLLVPKVEHVRHLEWVLSYFAVYHIFPLSSMILLILFPSAIYFFCVHIFFNYLLVTFFFHVLSSPSASLSHLEYLVSLISFYSFFLFHMTFIYFFFHHPNTSIFFLSIFLLLFFLQSILFPFSCFHLSSFQPLLILLSAFFVPFSLPPFFNIFSSIYFPTIYLPFIFFPFIYNCSFIYLLFIHFPVIYASSINFPFI